jgi:hypothetical protein
VATQLNFPPMNFYMEHGRAFSVGVNVRN